MRGGVTKGAVAVAALLLLAACGPRSAEDAARSGPEPPRLPEADRVAAAGAGGYGVLSVDFHDASHAFALLYRCPDPDDPAVDCEQRLSVLDGGERWQSRDVPLPPVTGGNGVSAVVLTLGPRTALITDYAPGAPALFTTDGGWTWSEVDTTATGTVDRIPPGATLAYWCDLPDENDHCPDPRVAAHDPRTGELRTLAHQPRLDLARDWRVEPSPDGGWWVWGRDRGTGDLALAVTRDGGLTWRTSRLAEDPGDVMWLDTFAGPDALYVRLAARSTSETDPTKNPLSAIYRSTDDGRTWELRWTHRAGRAPWSSLGPPMVGTDGSLLLVTEDDKVFRSRDGARTFQPDGTAAAINAASWVWRGRAGYVTTYGSLIWLSSDGTRWSEHDPAEPFGRGR